MVTTAHPRLEILRARREEIRQIAWRHRARSVSVFGSAARGDDHERSDIDLLVEFDQGSSLFDLMHLQDDLEVLPGLPVDVVSVGALTARDDHIRAEANPW